MSEAKIENNNIILSTWLRWVAGIAITAILAANAYSYYIVFPKTVESIVENDRDARKRDRDIVNKVHRNELAIARFMAIEKDIDEIKTILRRTAPYERKED